VIVRQQSPLHLSFENNGNCTTETVHSTRILEIKDIILCILQTLPIPASIMSTVSLLPSPTWCTISVICGHGRFADFRFSREKSEVEGINQSINRTNERMMQ
jgi:hypothetical protein